MSIENPGNGLRVLGVMCGVILAGFCLTGCRSHSPKGSSAKAPRGAATATAAPAAGVSKPAAGPVVPSSGLLEPEMLRIGDSLTITFTDTATLIPVAEEKIREDGTITLTLNQTFKADGKTRSELEKEIRARYVPDYFRQLTVTVKQLESTRWYYVNGEVRGPARQIYNSRITVLKAIASAGGFTDFANKKKVKLTRVDGRTMTVNCVKALDNPALDLEVYPNDTIHVPRRLF
jgi:protein involved in polysaccharide export with SLBB domain